MAEPARQARRDVDDPAEMRALAHPLRLKILDALRRQDTITATQASELTGESPANCSFHLRTLAKYGYLEEAPGGSGRQRPWRRSADRLRFSLRHADPAARALASELVERIADRREDQLRNWFRHHDDYPVEWQDAAFVSDRVVYLTPAEAAEFDRRFDELVEQFAGRVHDPTTRPVGAVPTKVVAWVHPLPD